MDNEMIPAAPVRNTAVGFIGTIAHARKYTWAQRPEVEELLNRLDELTVELCNQLPENKEDQWNESRCQLPSDTLR